MAYEKDPQFETEVYALEISNPPGKIVIRKGCDLVFVWPGDLPGLIERLIDFEWKQTVREGIPATVE